MILITQIDAYTHETVYLSHFNLYIWDIKNISWKIYIALI
jgi:hypothetical protein